MISELDKDAEIERLKEECEFWNKKVFFWQDREKHYKDYFYTLSSVLFYLNEDIESLGAIVDHENAEDRVNPIYLKMKETFKKVGDIPIKACKLSHLIANAFSVPSFWGKLNSETFE